ncbi:hypothetical protein ACF0H5_001422 [Mactra antiquata]
MSSICDYKEYDILETKTNFIETLDMPYYDRNQSDNTLGELVSRSEIQTLTLRLLGIKLENEQMQRRQEIKYNATKACLDNLHKQYDVAKNNNSKLLGEIRMEKDHFEKLRKEVDELRIRFVTYRKELKSVKKEKQFWNDTKELIKTTEMRCKRLSKINNSLKMVLSKHNPDPSSKSNALPKRKIISPASYRKPINAVAVRRKLTRNKLCWN